CFPVHPRGSAGTGAWPDRGPARPSRPAHPGAPYVVPPAFPSSLPSCWYARRSRPRMPARGLSEWCGESSTFVSSGLPSGSIVAIGYAVARLILLGHQAFATGRELVNGNGLDHLSLPGHQALNTRQCVADELAEPFELG